ncbi:MAG: glutamate--cysteine ligase [Gemmatimonadetes bacterium]|nr:glutamate--cysteine ligase [Gemmatimonadota bacterium]
MKRLGLFEGTGIEIEYMIVDAHSLDVAPVCDRLMHSVAGKEVPDIERGPIAWSNELALHVLELKTNGPASSLDGLSDAFHAEVVTANRTLAELGGTERGAVLLPGGVHPWMDPLLETALWPHEYNQVYRTFDRIFGCAGHGWSNLQSTHVNLPFSGDEEFGRLHAAVRVVLSLIPALAASSPFLDGIAQPWLDARLDAYRHNARLVPQVSGQVIPETVRSEQEYREKILEPLYRALEPHDPEGVLAHEWTNARGAIARFERGAIEIRVIDAQESPNADLAVVSLVCEVVRALVEERWTSRDGLDKIGTEVLSEALWDTARSGAEAVIRDAGILRAFGLTGRERSAGELWQNLADRVAPDAAAAQYGAVVEYLVGHGPLAARMSAAHGKGVSIEDVAGSLSACLAKNDLFGRVEIEAER